MSTIDITEREPADLLEDIRILRIRKRRTIGSTPELTRLIRRGIQQMIDECQAALKAKEPA